MKDYFYIINDAFLKKVKLNDDDSVINISTIRYKKDKQLIDDIINKKSYKYLNEKEINILKKFNNSIVNYNEENNLSYLKSILNNLLNSNIEEFIAFALKNRVKSILTIDTLFYNGSTYLNVSQGKNNITNTKLLENSEFLEKYKLIIKKIMNNFLICDDKLVEKIVYYDVNFYRARLSNSDRRDIQKNFKKYSVNDIKYNNIDFHKLIKVILNDTNVNINEIIYEGVFNSNFYTFFDESLKDPDFRYYIIWSYLIETSLISFGKLYDEIFELIKIVKGVKAKVLIDKKKYILNNYFIGHLISKEYFINIDPSVKINIKKYIMYIKKAFKIRLHDNAWMDPITKNTAIEKLDKINEDIYDSKLTDYNMMSELTNIYYENTKIINEFNFKINMQKLTNNQKIFYGNIYNINAFYDPTMNQIIFPYGILKEPYYYNNMTDLNIIAYNFGAIGGVIGHEIIHGFDDQGRLFDKDGNLKNWWQPESEKKYNEISEKIGSLYKKYNINPKLTMGENIADIGGVRISLSALKLYLSDNNSELTDKLLNNFIKGWAMIWRGKLTKQELANKIASDPHSTIRERVNIPLNNLKEIKDNNQDEIIELW
jgi:predicted metalloendopeptidase